MKRSYYLLIILCLLLLISCSTPIPRPVVSPAIGVPLSEVNKDIEFIFAKGENSFRNLEGLHYFISVISDTPLAFKGDYGARFFGYINSSWVEIEDKMERCCDEEVFILNRSFGNLNKTGGAHFAPYIPGLKEVVIVRLYVFGNRVRDGKITDEVTAAYIEFELSPSNW